MNLKIFLLLGGMGFVLHGCSSMNALTSDSLKSFTSPQDVIDKKNINENNSSAKEYVYDWGKNYPERQVESLIPRSSLSNYCISHGGRFSLFQKSSMHLVKDTGSKKLLNTYSSVKQGIGTYYCKQSDGQQWYVSIEPLSERRMDNASRVVNLQTKIMNLDEVKAFYSKAHTTTTLAEKKQNTVNSKTLNNVTSKTTPAKAIEDKKVTQPVVEDTKVQQTTNTVVSTPQTQQMQLYTSARKDLGRGQNQINACNTAERAYNYGRLRGTSSVNAYAESGILVAKCLTSVPSYSRRFSNPNDRAKRILQNLATNQNHAVAKHMLNQMK